MNRSLLPILAFCSIAIIANSAIAADQPKPNSGVPIPQITPAVAQQTKIAKIVTLQSSKEVQEFQSNVQILQTEYKNLLEIGAAADLEKDTKRKAELKKQYDQLSTKISDDMQKMSKAYNYVLGRNYIMDIERATVYTVLSPEEATKLEAEEKAKAATKK